MKFDRVPYKLAKSVCCSTRTGQAEPTRSAKCSLVELIGYILDQQKHCVCFECFKQLLYHVVIGKITTSFKY